MTYSNYCYVFTRDLTSYFCFMPVCRPTLICACLFVTEDRAPCTESSVYRLTLPQPVYLLPGFQRDLTELPSMAFNSQPSFPLSSSLGDRPVPQFWLSWSDYRWQSCLRKKLRTQASRRPPCLRACLSTGRFALLPSCMLPCHQTSDRLSSSYLVLYTLVSEHENKMTFYHKM